MLRKSLMLPARQDCFYKFFNFNGLSDKEQGQSPTFRGCIKSPSTYNKYIERKYFQVALLSREHFNFDRRGADETFKRILGNNFHHDLIGVLSSILPNSRCYSRRTGGSQSIRSQQRHSGYHCRHHVVQCGWVGPELETASRQPPSDN